MGGDDLSDEAPVPAGEITRLLHEMRGERPGCREDLFRLVNAELRRLAGIQMSRQRADHTLQPTALVNEACLRLLRADAAYEDRHHFLNSAARAMRSILVDHARTRERAKRGGGSRPVTFRETSHGVLEPGEEILAVHEALDRLERIDPRKARVVELRYFGGLTFGETARLIGVTERTVHRLWDAARAWLYVELGA